MLVLTENEIPGVATSAVVLRRTYNPVGRQDAKCSLMHECSGLHGQIVTARVACSARASWLDCVKNPEFINMYVAWILSSRPEVHAVYVATRGDAQAGARDVMVCAANLNLR